MELAKCRKAPNGASLSSMSVDKSKANGFFVYVIILLIIYSNDR